MDAVVRTYFVLCYKELAIYEMVYITLHPLATLSRNEIEDGGNSNNVQANSDACWSIKNVNDPRSSIEMMSGQIP